MISTCTSGMISITERSYVNHKIQGYFNNWGRLFHGEKQNILHPFNNTEKTHRNLGMGLRWRFTVIGILLIQGKVKRKIFGKKGKE